MFSSVVTSVGMVEFLLLVQNMLFLSIDLVLTLISSIAILSGLLLDLGIIFGGAVVFDLYGGRFRWLWR